MSKKSPALGAVLGFFILGLFYSTGFTKKGCSRVHQLGYGVDRYCGTGGHCCHCRRVSRVQVDEGIQCGGWRRPCVKKLA